MGCLLIKGEILWPARFLSAAPAMPTQAKQRHVIHVDAKVMLVIDRFDQQRQRRMIDLFDRVALAADEMMMRLVARDLVIGAVAPVHGVNQPHLAQEIQRAIDGRAADGRILLVHVGIHLLGRDVRSGLTDDVQNQMTLRRQSITLRMKLVGKIHRCV